MDIETILYEKLCRGCAHEKKCHDHNEHCDNYYKELDKEIDDDTNDLPLW